MEAAAIADLVAHCPARLDVSLAPEPDHYNLPPTSTTAVTTEIARTRGILGAPYHLLGMCSSEGSGCLNIEKIIFRGELAIGGNGRRRGLLLAGMEPIDRIWCHATYGALAPTKRYSREVHAHDLQLVLRLLHAVPQTRPTDDETALAHAEGTIGARTVQGPNGRSPSGTATHDRWLRPKPRKFWGST